MVAAMLVGMVALGAALRSVLALAGLRYPTQYPEVAALEMAATMSAGMVAWMRHRRPRSQLDQPAAVARLLPLTQPRIDQPHRDADQARLARVARRHRRRVAVQPRRAAVPGRCPAPSRPAHQARSA
jgi:hypothetical protein